ncbi:MAG: hypothetical protein Q8R13_02530, partial [bacterium]|nr:hypothetical protein [bacterium]
MDPQRRPSWSLFFNAECAVATHSRPTLSLMDALTISSATEEEVRSGDIGRRLRHFNYGVIGEYPETQYIRLN